MEFRKVTAIIQQNVLDKVEEKLQEIGVRGISISKVKGYGEYANFYTSDWITTHSRIEIFTDKSKAEEIATTIMNAAHTGISGDGIVAVLPVEKVYRIRTRVATTAGEL